MKSAAKGNALGGALDDFTESKRKLETLGDMPDIDLTMHEGGESVGENLEAADDDEEALEKSATKIIEDVDEEEDPLDAFMSGVTKEVAYVNGHESKRNASSRLGARVDDMADDGPTIGQTVPVDEIDATALNPEEILA